MTILFAHAPFSKCDLHLDKLVFINLLGIDFSIVKLPIFYIPKDKDYFPTERRYFVTLSAPEVPFPLDFLPFLCLNFVSNIFHCLSVRELAPGQFSLEHLAFHPPGGSKRVT